MTERSVADENSPDQSSPLLQARSAARNLDKISSGSPRVRMVGIEKFSDFLSSMQPRMAKIDPIGDVVARAAAIGTLPQIVKIGAIAPAFTIGSAIAQLTPRLAWLESNRFAYRAALTVGADLAKANMASLEPLRLGAAFDSSLKLARLLSLGDSVPSAFRQQFSELQRSGLLDAINDASPDTVEALLREAMPDEAATLQPELAGAPNTPGQDAEEQLLSALRAPSGNVRLSKGALFLLMAIMMWLYTTVAQWHDFRESLCDINARVGAAPDASSARRAVNEFLCGVPASLRPQVRLVNRDNVRLREGPSMKASIIMVLPIYSTLEVVDSIDRTWLKVAYKHGDLEIVGWVSRSMVRTAPRR